MDDDQHTLEEYDFLKPINDTEVLEEARKSAENLIKAMESTHREQQLHDMLDTELNMIETKKLSKNLNFKK